VKPRTSNLFTRDDTFFGICQGLGEDLGIAPNLLRLALTLTLFFDPPAAIGIYLGLGAIVMAVRFVSPDPRPAPVVEAEAQEADEAVEAEPVALAA